MKSYPSRAVSSEVFCAVHPLVLLNDQLTLFKYELKLLKKYLNSKIVGLVNK